MAHGKADSAQQIRPRSCSDSPASTIWPELWGQQTQSNLIVWSLPAPLAQPTGRSRRSDLQRQLPARPRKFPKRRLGCGRQCEIGSGGGARAGAGGRAQRQLRGLAALGRITTTILKCWLLRRSSCSGKPSWETALAPGASPAAHRSPADRADRQRSCTSTIVAPRSTVQRTRSPRSSAGSAQLSVFSFARLPGLSRRLAAQRAMRWQRRPPSDQGVAPRS